MFIVLFDKIGRSRPGKIPYIFGAIKVSGSGSIVYFSLKRARCAFVPKHTDLPESLMDSTHVPIRLSYSCIVALFVLLLIALLPLFAFVAPLLRYS